MAIQLVQFVIIDIFHLQVNHVSQMARYKSYLLSSTEGEGRKKLYYFIFIFFTELLFCLDQFLFGRLYLCMTSLKRCICLCTTTYFHEEIQLVTHTKTLTLFFMTSVLSIFSDTNQTNSTPLSQKYKYFFSNESRKTCLSLKRKKKIHLIILMMCNI